MPRYRTCAVVGCNRKNASYTARLNKNGLISGRFFAIPSVLKNDQEFTRARRNEWLSRLNLKESQVDQKNTVVCSAHFHSGIVQHLILSQ